MSNRSSVLDKRMSGDRMARQMKRIKPEILIFMVSACGIRCGVDLVLADEVAAMTEVEGALASRDVDA